MQRFRPFWIRPRTMLDVLFWLIFRKEAERMAMAYATLIIKGKKSFQDVPDRIKDQVKEILYSLDCGWMAEE